MIILIPALIILFLLFWKYKMKSILKGKTLLMGILNVTPDSFYDGNKYFNKNLAIERAYRIEAEGADIIDIGGESTRPGAKSVSVQEEIDRVCPVIEAVIKDLHIPISIDTYKSRVADEAIRLGAAIINDISGLNFDSSMADVAARHGCDVIIMHINGTPGTMQQNPKYSNLLEEIYNYLKNAVSTAINKGIKNENIIIDPGIGFGKSLMDNYKILNNIIYFKAMGYPVLIGISMKSLVGKLYEENEDRLPATIALNAISVTNGADIIRVHDVKAHRLALEAVEKYKEAAN
jgi:dihydropteroate synthase